MIWALGELSPYVLEFSSEWSTSPSGLHVDHSERGLWLFTGLIFEFVVQSFHCKHPFSRNLSEWSTNPSGLQVQGLHVDH